MCLKGLRIPRVPAEIRTKHLPNTDLQRYRSVWRVTQYSFVYKTGYLTKLFQVHFFLLFLVGWDWVSWYRGRYWPIVPAPDDKWWWLWRNWWKKDWQGKTKYSEKTCPSATLSTTDPTWLDPDLNPGRRGGKPVTNRLSYGAAISSRSWPV
jgi:hypothetical protein